MEARVIELLPLAAKIAREFENIPGLPQSDIEMTAQEALARAARSFDPAKGDFAAYAATAMRNALRDLHERQARHHRHHIYNLDVTATSSDTARGMECCSLSVAARHWLQLPGNTPPQVGGGIVEGVM